MAAMAQSGAARFCISPLVKCECLIGNLAWSAVICWRGSRSGWEQVADIMSAQKRSAVMARIRGKDTQPELLIRRILHALGHRLLLHRRDLPGPPQQEHHLRPNAS